MKNVRGGRTWDFQHIISIENLLAAWQEFLPGKRSKPDVQEFALRLMDNLFDLHDDLANHTYTHGPYHTFNISDPKPRRISKASVRDRLLHHAVYRALYPFFSRRFIADSFSCQLGKGTHRALNRFRTFAYKVSKNHICTCWVLKCDIRKFFAGIDQDILLSILAKHISDANTCWLLERIIRSFAPGLPLGNLTSQLLVNIYMNKFDQFVKHRLKAKYYLRYADDFAVLSHDKGWLMELLPKVGDFLQEQLHLDLHPNKVSITTLASGVDFLGWVHFPDYRVLRTVAKRRMFRGLRLRRGNQQTVQSYLGLIGHGNTKKLERAITEQFSVSSSNLEEADLS
ncbi:MAG: group II intron reverse transcriptase domain-containing protein [Candidatus Yanofskybacteria bacterium]|nr:group II intron reverse transcriptase domain-containing protein [Candidatus Yanofskybacteria bacterium]